MRSVKKTERLQIRNDLGKLKFFMFFLKIEREQHLKSAVKLLSKKRQTLTSGLDHCQNEYIHDEMSLTQSNVENKSQTQPNLRHFRF